MWGVRKGLEFELPPIPAMELQMTARHRLFRPGQTGLPRHNHEELPKFGLTGREQDAKIDRDPAAPPNHEENKVIGKRARST